MVIVDFGLWHGGVIVGTGSTSGQGKHVWGCTSCLAKPALLSAHNDVLRHALAGRFALYALASGSPRLGEAALVPWTLELVSCLLRCLLEC